MTNKAWTETEVQGRGRRYWFRRYEDAVYFYEQKRAAGYRSVYDGNYSRTVWVPFAKTMNEDTRRQMAGMDPEN